MLIAESLLVSCGSAAVGEKDSDPFFSLVGLTYTSDQFFQH